MGLRYAYGNRRRLKICSFATAPTIRVVSRTEPIHEVGFMMLKLLSAARKLRKKGQNKKDEMRQVDGNGVDSIPK